VACSLAQRMSGGDGPAGPVLIEGKIETAHADSVA
jgi:hypothetical protein